MSPLSDGQDLVARRLYAVKPDHQQDAICTRDEQCQAAADGHEDDCPVEQRLRDELGF